MESTTCDECIEIDRFRTLLDELEVDELEYVFSSYCQNTLGLRRLDRRRKDNRNTYYASSKGYNGNKTECGIFHGRTQNFLDESLYIVLRKRSGRYIVIGKNNAERYLEIDTEVRHYDPEKLHALMREHSALFRKLGIPVEGT